MFGYMLFNNGVSNHKTPDEFQKRARQDIENHIKKFKAIESNNNDQMDIDIDNTITNDNTNDNNIINNNKHSSSPLLRSLKRSKTKKIGNNQLQLNQKVQQQQQQQQQQQHLSSRPINSNYNNPLTYGSSPLRQTVADSTILDSSDECSSIDSGKSGCSLTHASAQQLLHQQQESLQRIISRNSTLQSSLFSNDLNSLYTQDTLNSNNTLTSNNNINTTINNSNLITLNQALPKDFSDYYSPDLEVEKFSNGRPIFTKRPLKNWELNDLRSLLIYPDLKPEWINNKIPEIQSPYPNIKFKIQIIPNYLNDNQIIENLAHSEIYKESKFDLSFKLKTATYIVERARLRHKQILIDSFNINPQNFNEKNLLNNIQFDCYFKFEWRNIIENYLLNLGIENECRSEFKSKISKLKKIINEKKINSNSNSNLNKNSNKSLYKKVLLDNKPVITDDIKLNIWKDVQSQVYKKLNMDGWEVN